MAVAPIARNWKSRSLTPASIREPYKLLAMEATSAGDATGGTNTLTFQVQTAFAAGQEESDPNMYALWRCAADHLGSTSDEGALFILGFQAVEGVDNRILLDIFMGDSPGGGSANMDATRFGVIQNIWLGRARSNARIQFQVVNVDAAVLSFNVGLLVWHSTAFRLGGPLWPEFARGS